MPCELRGGAPPPPRAEGPNNFDGHRSRCGLRCVQEIRDYTEIMKATAAISCLLGLLGLSLFTILLVAHRISDVIYLGLLATLALVCIVILCLPRLKELDLKNLRMTLSGLKQV